MRSLCSALLAAVFLSAPAAAVSPTSPDQNAAAVKTALAKTRLFAQGFSNIAAFGKPPEGAEPYKEIKAHLESLKKLVQKPSADFDAKMALALILAQKPDGYKDLPDALLKLADAGDALLAENRQKTEDTGPAGTPGSVAYLNMQNGHGLGQGQSGIIQTRLSEADAAWARRNVNEVPADTNENFIADAPRPNRGETSNPTHERGLAIHDNVPLFAPFGVDYAGAANAALLPTSLSALASSPLSGAYRASIAPFSLKFGEDGASWYANQMVTKTFMGMSAVTSLMPPQLPTISTISPGKKDYFMVTPWVDVVGGYGHQNGWYGAALNFNAADSMGFGIKGQTDSLGSNKVSSSLTFDRVALNAGYRSNRLGDQTLSAGFSATPLISPNYKFQIDMGLRETLVKDFTAQNRHTVGAYANAAVEKDGVYYALETSVNNNAYSNKTSGQVMARMSAQDPFQLVAAALFSRN